MDPRTKQVMTMHETLFNWYNNYPSEWRPEIDALIQKCSGGEYRVFQTFFDSPEECLSGQFRTQVLSKDDITKMYPTLLESATKVPQNGYLYIFTCNGTLNEGKDALIGSSILTFE